MSEQLTTGIGPEIEPPGDDDPRGELLEPIPPQLVEHLRAGDPVAIREFRQRAAALIVAVDIQVTPNGAAVTVRWPEFGQQRFLPQDERRVRWEDELPSASPDYQRNLEAAQVLSTVSSSLAAKSPSESREFRLKDIRVACGAIYRFVTPDGRHVIAIRVNNDPFNVYCGHGNPYSSLVDYVRPSTTPQRIVQASVEEAIPCRVNPNTGKIEPYWPVGFFDPKASRDWRKYKRKCLELTGSASDERIVRDAYETRFGIDSTPTGVSLTFDYSAWRPGRYSRLENVSATLTSQGTLEIQTVIDIEPPDRIYDPEFGSRFVVADTAQIAQWWDAARKGQHAPFELEYAIDGQSGQRIAVPQVADFYHNRFQASPPLAVLCEKFHRSASYS